MKLTQSNIAKIRREAGDKDHIEWDEALPGFGLRVRDGRCTWIVQYKIGDKNRRITLGTTEQLTADEARDGWIDPQSQEKRAGAAKILVNARDGFDHVVARVERREKAAETLGVVITTYLEARKPVLRPRAYSEVKRHLEKYWQPLHDVPLRSVKRLNVTARVNAIARDNGAVTANLCRASLSAFYRWCIGEGICDANPVAGSNKREDINGPRERSLSDAEAAAIWLATPDGDYGNIIKLLFLTGCRLNEIGCLQWSEVNLETKTITLPATRTKNHTEHTVPLTDKAVAILEAIPRRVGRDLVFGVGKGGFGAWTKAKLNLQAKSKTEGWTPHDIRRTVRTGLGKLGVEPHVAEACLNHLPARLIRTYDRNTYAAEKRAALDAWASHLSVVIAQATGANVTTLRKA
jgi:integrase